MIDPAPILLADETLSNDQRADLWDVFHGAANHWTLADSLRDTPLSDDTKRHLLQAKFQSQPAAIRAIQRMSEMDRTAIDTAESHRRVLEAMVAAQARGGR